MLETVPALCGIRNTDSDNPYDLPLFAPSANDFPWLLDPCPPFGPPETLSLRTEQSNGTTSTGGEEPSEHFPAFINALTDFHGSHPLQG